MSPAPDTNLQAPICFSQTGASTKKPRQRAGLFFVYVVPCLCLKLTTTPFLARPMRQYRNTVPVRILKRRKQLSEWAFHKITSGNLNSDICSTPITGSANVGIRSLKRIAFYHIHTTRFNSLLLRISPKTGHHFWETCSSAQPDHFPHPEQSEPELA